MTQDAISDLADPKTLRVGVNVGNILLVTGKAANGDPEGISPDIGKMIAERLGVAVKLVAYPRPGDVADAAVRNEWDICLIAHEPKRAETIGFCQAYVEILSTYLVPAGSSIKSIEDVDKPGVRIAVSERSAYDLYLERTIKHATLHRGVGLPGALKVFVDEKLDALAGLVPALLDNAKELPGSTVLPGYFTLVRQAVGTRPEAKALNAFVNGVLTEAKADGTVQKLIDKHGVTGKLQVATDN